MINSINIFAIIFSLFIFSSCTSPVDTDNFVPDSQIEIIKGTAADVSEVYSDSLFSHPYSIDALSRDSSILYIDVTYAGGEGGCPAHMFVINWDEIIHDVQTSSPSVELGLAHYLPTTENCEAIVEERLEVDLINLLGDELDDNISFTVTNLVDSTQVSLNP
jgi:hypothetical protein